MAWLFFSQRLNRQPCYMRDIPSHQGHQVRPLTSNIPGQTGFQGSVSSMIWLTQKNKTRPAAGTVLVVLSAAFSPNLEGRSPEGLPQLTKLTHPSNIECYNLIQESNYQVNPSTSKRKRKSQPTTARDTSREFHSEVNPGRAVPCLPSLLSPHSTLAAMMSANSRSRLSDGTVCPSFIWSDVVCSA